MPISSLSLTNFRSYSSLSFSFTSPVLVLLGRNGSGKTNFLEAISFLGTTRSFRAKTFWEMVKWGEDVGVVSCEAEGKDARRSRLGMIIDTKKRQRTFRCDRESISVLEFIGNLPVVLFAPDDVLLVSGSPKIRRQYLDAVHSLADSSYFRDLIEYGRVVRHRTTLLSSIRDRLASPDELEFWDKRLVALGSAVFSKRLALISWYNRELSRHYETIAGNEAHCFLDYRPAASGLDIQICHDRSVCEVELERAVAAYREREIRYGRTLVGPHLDDFQFVMNDRPFESFGSRGEVRSMILALKMCERGFLQEKLGCEPTMLFDDVFSELDPHRQERLLSSISGTQVIFTATDIHGVQTLPHDALVIDIDGGGHGFRGTASPK